MPADLANQDQIIEFIVFILALACGNSDVVRGAGFHCPPTKKLFTYANQTSY